MMMSFEDDLYYMLKSTEIYGNVFLLCASGAKWIPASDNVVI